MHGKIIFDIYSVFLEAKLEVYFLHFNIDVVYHKHNTKANACARAHAHT